MSIRIHCEDVKQVLGSVHKMSLGGNVVVLDGKKVISMCASTKGNMVLED